MACPNPPNFVVKTAYGSYHLCQPCMNHGHMAPYDKPRELDDFDASETRCQCEHLTHAHTELLERFNLVAEVLRARHGLEPRVMFTGYTDIPYAIVLPADGPYAWYCGIDNDCWEVVLCDDMGNEAPGGTVPGGLPFTPLAPDAVAGFIVNVVTSPF